MSGSVFSLLAARSRRFPVALAAALFGLLALSAAAQAASFTVNDFNDAALMTPAGTACVSTDGGACTLRAAVQAADNTGGANTITLPAGSYKLTIASTAANDPSNGDLDVKNTNSLTLNGAGASSTTINANQIDRAFAVASGSALSLSGVTITNGNPSGSSSGSSSGGDVYSDGTLSISGSVLENSASSGNGGGAIYNNSGALTLTGDTLTSIESTYGAGVYLQGGTLSDTGSTFVGLAAFDSGGAVYAHTAAVSATFSNSTFTDNGAGNGGAIDVEGGSLSVTGATFAGNFASSSSGGAIYDSSTGAATVSRTVFNGNGGSNGGAIYANGAGGLTVSLSRFTRDNASYGGGIYANVGALSVTQSTFDHESAGYDEGGGLYLNTAGAVTVANTTLSNDRSGYGGGIYIAAGAPSLVNDTITGNQSRPGRGGGIYAGVPPGGIENTIVANNVGGDCGASTGAADLGNNIDSDGSCFTATGATGDHVGVDPMLGPLQDNGGPGPTQELLSGSPALGTGNDAACAAAPVNGVDELGVSRPQGSHCDIGAIEAAAADVAITEAAPASATAGTPIAYTLTVSDNGPGPAGNVTVTDALPAGTTYFDSSSSQGSCSGTTTVVCSLGSLAKGATATVTIRVVPGGPGQLTNTATVSASQPDPNAANNTATGHTTVITGPTVTAFVPPVVITGVASQITTSKAKLSAIINPAGLPTTYSIQYGTSKKYGKTAKGKTLAAGTTPKGVVISVKGLKAGKRYHFRIVATNSAGTSRGQDVTFKTKNKKKKHR